MMNETSSVLIDLLRSRPATTSSALTHAYLKNKLLLLGERTAAEVFQEAPTVLNDIGEKLNEILDTFVSGYDPSHFVVELRPLQVLGYGLRDRLLVAVRREYLGRFCPSERLDRFRFCAASFVDALHAWHDLISTVGVSETSAPLWSTLRLRAMALRDLLEDRELSTRWIP